MIHRTTLPFEKRAEFTSLLNRHIELDSRRLQCDHAFWQPQFGDSSLGTWWYNYWRHYVVQAMLFYEGDQAVISMDFILYDCQLRWALVGDTTTDLESHARYLAFRYHMRMLEWQVRMDCERKVETGFKWSKEGF